MQVREHCWPTMPRRWKTTGSLEGLCLAKVRTRGDSLGKCLDGRRAGRQHKGADSGGARQLREHRNESWEATESRDDLVARPSKPRLMDHFKQADWEAVYGAPPSLMRRLSPRLKKAARDHGWHHRDVDTKGNASENLCSVFGGL